MKRKNFLRIIPRLLFSFLHGVLFVSLCCQAVTRARAIIHSSGNPLKTASFSSVSCLSPPSSRYDIRGSSRLPLCRLSYAAPSVSLGNFLYPRSPLWPPASRYKLRVSFLRQRRKYPCNREDKDCRFLRGGALEAPYSVAALTERILFLFPFSPAQGFRIPIAGTGGATPLICLKETFSNHTLRCLLPPACARPVSPEAAAVAPGRRILLSSAASLSGRLERLSFSSYRCPFFCSARATPWPRESRLTDMEGWRRSTSLLSSASSAEQAASLRAWAADTTGEKEEEGDTSARQQGVEHRRFQITGLADELQHSFLCYAYSTILSRALPDARDGLKPVHRRLIYAMHQLRLHASGSFRKCARVVGEVLGKFHPHGDQAVYDALVRLSQTFVVSHPLIEGHGNFGSVDGDPPAAMRYTECRLTRFAEDVLLGHLDEKVVPFKPNFDASEREPLVFPARVPLLLVQGSSGIAVGMSTQIPPHNLHEVIDATIALIRNPSLSAVDLSTILPGPDFPTGGLLMNAEEMEDAYARGHGRVQLRGKAHVEGEEEEEDGPLREDGSNRGRVREKSEGSGSQKKSDKSKPERRLVITELPYTVNKSTLLQAVGHMVASKFLEGVSSIRDESDWRGVRIVLVLRPEVEAQVVLSTLLKHTNLQTFVPINLIALDNHGTRPCRFSLKSMLLAWISFRFETLRRMLAAEREERERRSHLLEGLLRAVGHMDTVVKAVRESFSASEAHHRLTSAPLGFSPPQANALLRLTLSRLTGLERQEIQREHEEQMSRLNRLQELLNHDKEIYGLMIEELQEIRDAHKAARRTKIVQTAAQRRKAKQRTEVLNSKPGVQSGPGAVECRPPRGRNTQCAKDDETRSTAERNRSGSTEHSGESLPESTNNAFLQDDQAAAASQNNRDGTGARYPSQSAIGKEGRETAHLLTQERKNEQVRRPYGSPASCIRPESEGGQTRSCPSKLSGTEELESLEKDGTVLRSQEGSLGKDVGVLRNARETDSSLASGADRKVQENREEEEEAVVPFGEAQEIDEEDLIPSHQNVVLFSAAPYLRRLPLSQVPTLKRGAVGMRTAPVTPGLSRQPTESCVPQESDLSGGDAKVGTAAPAASEESRKPGTYSTAIHGLCVCRSRDRLLIVTREGFACSLPAYKIPLGSRLSRGVGLPQLLLTASRGKRKTARTGSQTGRTTGFHPEVPTKSCEDGGKESTRMDPGQAHLAAVLALPYSSAVRRDKKSNKWGGKIREPGQSKLIVATKRGMMAKIDVSLLLNRRGFTRGLRKVIACASGDCVVAAGIVEELGNEKTSSSGRLGMSARQERGRTVALVEGQAEQNVNGERKEPADRSSRERKEATEGSSEEESHFHRGLESPRHLTHSSRLNSDLEKGYTCEPADAFRHSKSTLLIVTRLGRAVHFSTSSVRETRTGKSRGVHAIRLKSGDSVIALAVVPPPRKREGKPHGVTLREVAREELSPSGMSSLEKRASGQECVRDQDPEDKAPDVLVVTTSGVGKRMSLSSLGLRKRGGTGVKIIQLKQEANAKRLLDRQQRVRPDEPAEGTHLRIPEQQEPRNHGDEDRAIIRRRLPDSGSAPQARPQGQSSAGRDKQEHVVSVLLVPCPRTHGGAQERGGQGDILLVSREGFLLRQVSGKVPVLRGRLARGVTLQNLQHSKRDDAIVAAGLAR